MERRRFLIVTGAALTAGCGSETDRVEESTPIDIGSDSQTTPIDNESNAQTTTPEPVVDAQIVESSVVNAVDESLREIAIQGIVENTGDVLLSYLTIEAQYFTADDELVDTRTGRAQYLEPGDQWEFWLSYWHSDFEVEKADVEVSSTTASQIARSPEGIELESSDIEIPAAESASPRVTGRIRNNRSGEANIRVGTKVYAKNGNVIGTGSDRVNYADTGAVWTFSAPITIYNSDWKSRIDSYEAIVYIT